MSSSLQCNHHYILHNATLYERIRPPATICILLFKPPLNSIPHTPKKTTRPNNRTTCDMCFSVRPLSILSLCLSPDSRASLSRSSKPSRWTDKPVSAEEQLQPKAHLAHVESFALMYRKTRFYTTPAESFRPWWWSTDLFICVCVCVYDTTEGICIILL